MIRQVGINPGLGVTPNQESKDALMQADVPDELQPRKSKDLISSTRNSKASKTESTSEDYEAKPTAKSAETNRSFKGSLNRAIDPKKENQVTAANGNQKQPNAVASTNANATAAAAETETVQGSQAQAPQVPITFEGAEPETEDVTKSVESSGEIMAVIKFMLQMQKEFNVPPEKLVDAMSNAQSRAALADPSVQSLSARIDFFENLGLEGHQVRRAEMMYQNMLKEMAQESMSSYLQDNNQTGELSLLSPSDLRKRENSRSVDRMQQSFFLNDVRPPYGKVPEGPLERPPVGDQAQIQNTSGESNSTGAVAIPAGMEQSDMRFADEFKNESWQQPVQAPMQQNAGEVGKSTTQNTAKNNVDANSSSDSDDDGFSLSALGIGAGALGGAATDTGKAGMSSASGDSSNGKEQNTKSQVVDTVAGRENSQTPQNSLIDANAKPVAAPVGLAAMNKPKDPEVRPEDAANVRNLIQGAQYLVKQNGGEMKVQMYPEGLGQVDLKVTVKDGKVDIQILADTADTKRLLERNIGDLKASLTSHRLQVDNFKVDVSQNMDRDLSQQNTDLNREQARNFLGQFRDERESLRSGMFDTGRVKSYGNNSVASQVSSSDSASAQPAKKNSSRLNVIA